MSVLDQITEKIIKEQELIIGPLAWIEAQKVPGLKIDQAHHEASLAEGDPKAAIDNLVARYERLFGRASHEVCIEAVSSLIRSLAQADIPSSLRA